MASEKPDKWWFKKKIDESVWGSARQLAMVIKGRGRNGRMDHASLSRMLSGDREMLLSEAVELSELLGVPLDEIVRHALPGRKKTRAP